MDLGTLSVGIKADVSPLERDLGKATGLIDRFDSKFSGVGTVADGLGGKLSKLGGIASGALSAGLAAAAAGAAALGAGLVALGGIAIKVGIEAVQAFIPFQKQMSEVFTLLPDISEKAMGEMTGDVKDFAKEFGVLPDKVIPALYESLSAGVPQDNVFAFLETAQKAAVGGVTDLAVAVDGLTSVTNAYGADVIDATKASDIMFQTVKIGKTTFDELSRSLFNVNPVAASLGLGFEDVGAALAAMTAQGVPTSVATTQLRQLLLELSQAGTDVSDAFQSITGKTFQEFIAEGGNLQEALQAIEGGFTSVEDSSAKINSITEKISDLKDQLEVATIRQGEFTSQTSMATKVASENKIADLTQEIAKLESELVAVSSVTGESHTKMSDLFGSVEAGSAALILTGKGTDAFTNSLTAMEEAAGSTEAAFGTMDATISQNLERIRAAGQVLLIEIGEKLAPVFGQGVELVLQKIPLISQAILGMVDKSLPYIQKLFGWFQETAVPWITEFATRAGEILTKFFGDFDKNFGPSVRRLESSINMIASAFENATGETNVMDGILKGLQVVLNIVATGFDVWTRNIESTVRGVTTLINILRTVYNVIRDIVNLIPNLIGSGLFSLSGGKTFQQLTGRAGGGSVLAGNPYIVGEAGPEVFIPNQSGQIIPNDMLGGSFKTLSISDEYLKGLDHIKIVWGDIGQKTETVLKNQEALNKSLNAYSPPSPSSASTSSYSKIGAIASSSSEKVKTPQITKADAMAWNAAQDKAAAAREGIPKGWKLDETGLGYVPPEYDPGDVWDKKLGKWVDPITRMAEGGQFVVPAGYPNDSFLMGVTSGELVTVQPAGSTTYDQRSVTMNIHSQTREESLINSYYHAKAMID